MYVLCTLLCEGGILMVGTCFFFIVVKIENMLRLHVRHEATISLYHQDISAFCSF